MAPDCDRTKRSTFKILTVDKSHWLCSIFGNHLKRFVHHMTSNFFFRYYIMLVSLFSLFEWLHLVISLSSHARLKIINILLWCRKSFCTISDGFIIILDNLISSTLQVEYLITCSHFIRHFHKHTKLAIIPTLQPIYLQFSSLFALCDVSKIRYQLVQGITFQGCRLHWSF